LFDLGNRIVPFPVHRSKIVREQRVWRYALPKKLSDELLDRAHRFLRVGLRVLALGSQAGLVDNLGRAEAGHEIDENYLAAFGFDKLVA
jgi:hypothetical protein